MRNPIQFAVVREDPQIEKTVVARTAAKRVLLIGSGGCTALSLQAWFPELEITVLDPNPAQLALLERKVDALQKLSIAERRSRFNIATDDPNGLNACGNFESLFRSFRRFLEELVLPASDWQRLFREDPSDPALLEGALRSPYWPVAFDLHFHENLLRTMFGNEAIQHAPPGSYPRYFQAVFERGLKSPGASRNYFLHHVFLGGYRDDPSCWPPYLQLPIPRYRFQFRRSTLDQIDSLSQFDLISLSNIFDWTDEAGIASVCARLRAETKPGCGVILRQLNHQKDFSPHFGRELSFDVALATELLGQDRSLFYSKLSVAFRNPGANEWKH